ncbi:MAG: tyrosine-type recombinase/integrase [Streptosporangiaceae bacterium]
MRSCCSGPGTPCSRTRTETRSGRGGWSARSGQPGQRYPACRDGFRYHDLRHYLASFLIAHGADVKLVQARLRHASAKTTLDTYGHLWPDRDESTRTPLAAVFEAGRNRDGTQARSAGVTAGQRHDDLHTS